MTLPHTTTTASTARGRARRRRAGRVLIAAGIGAALLLTACAPRGDGSDGGSSPDDAETTLMTFLRALADGELSTALAMSTWQESDFACRSLTADLELDSSIAAPEIDAITVDGDRADAEVTYRLPSEVTEQISLERVDDRWLVVPPEGWRIEVGFDGPTVADVMIEDDCALPVRDGRAESIAWPGNYTMTVVDPSGVTERWEELLYRVPDGQHIGTDDPAALPAVPELAVNVLQSEIGSLLTAALDDCVASGLTGPTCPPELRGATPTGAAPGTGYVFLDRVWTDDDETWRFATQPGTLDVVRDGQPVTASFVYQGTLGVDASGELTIAVDQG
ncbi:hypothetical protein AB0N73_13620 [Microbacterium sp. NPDC089189]|uniref:hypothetical protein n=1 Tax=Microbacterium sp. NPDC089189 TaxID=3154972 RepID=UPI0034206B12